MPVNTRDKRFSMMALACPNHTRVWPNPDSSFANQSDRQQLAYLYAGVMGAIIVTLFDGLTTSIRLTGVGH